VTSPIDERVSSRAARATSRLTLSSVLAAAVLAAAAAHITFPCTQYQSDPVGFARDVLGVSPWEKQVEILEAIRDNKRVAVTSGHKVSKSHTDAIAALWFYASFPDARVVMSSTTSRQVDQILWRELKMMVARAKHPIDGEIHELARSGFKSVDFREVVGFTAREAEAVAGISGRNLFYILDEASGIPQVIFDAIEGNRAGGARVLLTSNPTRTEGEFFAAFHEKAEFYKTIRVSSEDTPNARAGREIIPGLATREWIEEKKREWGEDSPLYKVRVKGEFVKREDGKIVSLHAIEEAEKRWHELTAEGRLQIGLDPAGPGNSGDETAFAPRRGEKVINVLALRGLTEDGIITNALGLLKQHRASRERERPALVIDREGPIGSALFGRLRAISEGVKDESKAFDVVGVRASDRAQREPHIYDRMRDELLGNLSNWLRAGGAIPEDTKLAAELHAPEWTQTLNGLLKATAKVDLRKQLGRSPDRADAVALAVWSPRSLDEQRTAAEQSEGEDERIPVLDPYAGLAAWR
jgi:phage terminase large subunit